MVEIVDTGALAEEAVQTPSEATDRGLRAGLKRWHDVCPCCFSEAYPEGFEQAVAKLTVAATGPAADRAWPVFMAKLLRREEIARGTMAFYFEKPADWSFDAGQYIEISLIDPPETDAEGSTRRFSIASAPHEDRIMVATRMRDSAFKRSLTRIPIGTEVKIEGPFGDLRLHHNVARPAVLLSGGIGVTPFRSIVADATHRHLEQRIVLLLVNRRPADAPFLAELQSAAKANPHLMFIPTMSELTEPGEEWRGETGAITTAMLQKNLVDVVGAVYYITGPAGLVRSLRSSLTSMGIDDEDVRTEEFTGY